MAMTDEEMEIEKISTETKSTMVQELMKTPKTLKDFKDRVEIMMHYYAENYYCSDQPEDFDYIIKETKDKFHISGIIKTDVDCCNKRRNLGTFKASWIPSNGKTRSKITIEISLKEKEWF